jgi:hypothetical protein
VVNAPQKPVPRANLVRAGTGAAAVTEVGVIGVNYALTNKYVCISSLPAPSINDPAMFTVAIAHI